MDASKKDALFKVAAKIKVGKKLTHKDRDLSSHNPAMLVELLYSDELDSGLKETIAKTCKQNKTDLIEMVRKKMPYPNKSYPAKFLLEELGWAPKETEKETGARQEPIVSIEKILDAVAKIKAGKSLTAEEEKLCIYNFDRLSIYFSLNDLNEYFWMTKRVAGDQINSKLYAIWAMKSITTPEEVPTLKAPQVISKVENEPYKSSSGQELSSNINHQDVDKTAYEPKANINITEKSLPSRSVSFTELDAAKIRGWIFVGFIILSVLSATTFGTRNRIGCECVDGTSSYAIGSGACSHHGGVSYWKHKYWWD